MLSAEDLGGRSDHAIRAGYIGLAEWLVKGQAIRQALMLANGGVAAVAAQHGGTRAALSMRL